MFLSVKWLESSYAKKPEIKKVVKILFDARFEKLMVEILNVSFQGLIDDLLFNFEKLPFTDFCIIFYVREGSTNCGWG